MKAIATTCALLVGAACASHAIAQNYPVTANQRATAQQVAQQGVPLSALAPDAPDSYTVRKGDTLWRISGVFLRQPWRWPELWGMNMQAIANPHLIYPGQTLYLERVGGFARLRTSPGAGASDTIKLSPTVRTQSLHDLALPTLQMNLIEPYLTEPLVILEPTLNQAPRLIAASDERLFMSPGDEVYARSSDGMPFTAESDDERLYRIFREAKPLLDPVSKEVLGYEAQYVGKAELMADETFAEDGSTTAAGYRPATLHVTQVKEEIRAGDRLLPEPPRQYLSFVPHAPQDELDARVVGIYTSNAMRYGTQHQIVTINKGEYDGVQPGMVLSLITQGMRITDRTDPQRASVQLPDQANGTAMVFRVFNRVSYVLVMDVRRGVQVGDRLGNPH